MAQERGHPDDDDEASNTSWTVVPLDGSIPNRIAATSARLDASEATDDLAELRVAPAVRRQRHLGTLPYPPNLDVTPGLGGVQALHLGGGGVRAGGGNEDDDDHGYLLTLQPDKISARARGSGAVCFTVRERQTTPPPDRLLLVKKL